MKKEGSLPQLMEGRSGLPGNRGCYQDRLHEKRPEEDVPLDSVVGR